MTMFQDARTRTMAKRGIAFAAAVAVLMFGVAPADAWWRGGVWCGPGPCGPYWGYPYYAPPVVVEPAPPPVVVQPSPPPVVVQPSPPPAVVQAPAPQVYVQPDDRAAHDSYFYYCESAKAYYPNVKECPQGWTRVAPQPTSGGAAK
jgi:hypothetical protein